MNDEIANLIGYWDWENKTANQCADSILSLPSLREALEKATGTCEWAEEDGIVQTGCGTELWFDDIVDEHYVKQCPFCPCCGRRIEVKDGQG